jgi:hypothetical protein
MKAIIACSVFAILCAAANWHYTSTLKAEHSTTTIKIDGASLIIIFCAISLFFIFRSIYKLIRVCLDRGIRIPEKVKFIEWGPCVFLLPMLITWEFQSSQDTPQGLLTYSYGYGSTFSAFALIAAVITIAAYQVSIGLRRYKMQTEQGAAANP